MWKRRDKRKWERWKTRERERDSTWQIQICRFIWRSFWRVSNSGFFFYFQEVRANWFKLIFVIVFVQMLFVRLEDDLQKEDPSDSKGVTSLLSRNDKQSDDVSTLQYSDRFWCQSANFDNLWSIKSSSRSRGRSLWTKKIEYFVIFQQ